MQRTKEQFDRLALALAHPEVFPAGDAIAAHAFRGIVLAQVMVGDLPALRRALDCIGREAMADVLGSVRREVLSEAIECLDPHAAFPRNVPAGALAEHILALAGGFPTAYPPVDPLKVDLKALRRMRRQRGADLVAWLESRRDVELRAMVRRLDPRLPGLSKLEGPDAIARLAALSEGCEPVPDLRLVSVDLKGLRAARRRMGDGTFRLWASGRKEGEVKAFAKRIRRHGKLPEAGSVPEALHLLSETPRRPEAVQPVPAPTVQPASPAKAARKASKTKRRRKGRKAVKA